MKTIAIIPARGGSKRLPQKNIKLLDEIPLLAHSILYAKANSKIIDEVYVSTEDPEIKKVALKYGAKVIDRPENISGDLEPTVSALKHVLENIDLEVENVILLQPTNPVRPENLVQKTFEIYDKIKCNSLFTVSRDHKKLGKIIDQKFVPFNYKIGQRSQDLEPLYFENGLLYITKSKLIMENIIISEDAFPFEIDHIFANVDIDTQADFDYAKYLYYKNIKN
ncbi:CMP-N,N'-diacetyllegionaminic acid synthase [Flavobacterium bizetiae]|uniref:CMP-N,N'-diacetyllegionaminic acid synthase n=1 Tax=Flavobacterium bizetiae TaxID=2704140 RepID=A0A6J4GXP8_9FLAO|nr:acylneuraminate cytidylyltransferase family protein [Flavobacterium bizetiae]CAA9203682.1 CMP-N,N'-diacetyllegionaminic acid synthase [Flavobacterium bizetiae]CAD5344526.1 CMP-N,N'-diacetyllegionaminic acid synthase [Flavobacterium bizetiae]CAD5350595.1 CMP-N,N'-diacetyllegionaminic acid synthase [Flavobacterium bizetiae]